MWTVRNLRSWENSSHHSPIYCRFSDQELPQQLPGPCVWLPRHCEILLVHCWEDYGWEMCSCCLVSSVLYVPVPLGNKYLYPPPFHFTPTTPMKTTICFLRLPNLICLLHWQERGWRRWGRQGSNPLSTSVFCKEGQACDGCHNNQENTSFLLWSVS